MKKHLLFVLVLLLFACESKNNIENISSISEETQKSLQKWQDSKYGLFIHYGLYSVAGGVWKGEKVPYYAEQIMNHARIPVSEYEKLGEGFTAENWCADSVVVLAKNAGMKYIVITSKHHDGFSLYHSKVSSYNTVQASAAKRDIIGELAEACRKYNMPLGFYYSLPDWHYEGGLKRIEIDTTTNCTEFVNQVYSPLEHITPQLEEYIVAQLTELLTQYGDICTIWFDMGLLTPEQSQRFRDTVKSLQPKCLVSGRVMNNCGDYLTLPDNGNVAGFTDLAWDNPASLYGTWGYRSWCVRPELSIQIEKQLGRLLKTVSHGGVFLLNVGPDGTGQIIPYEQNVLKGIGKWLDMYSEAIYDTDATKLEFDNSKVYATQKGNNLYLIVRDFEVQEISILNSLLNVESAYTLRGNKKVNVIANGKNTQIEFTEKLNNEDCVVVIELDKDIEINHKKVAFQNDRYILTEQNATVHSAFNAKGYITTQSKSYLTWTLENVENGRYSVFVEYMPYESANEYLFKIGNLRVKHILPGVDRMLQTCAIGEFDLTDGDVDFEINLAQRSNPLSSLGLDINRIIIRQENK